MQQPRYVDPDLCVGCGLCSEKCPAKAPSEFDEGLSMRKAIYTPFPQAVPNTYLVDDEACTYIQSEGKRCGVCKKNCPKDCIDLDAKVEVVEIEVGNIILATGYKVFDAVGPARRMGRVSMAAPYHGWRLAEAARPCAAPETPL